MKFLSIGLIILGAAGCQSPRAEGPVEELNEPIAHYLTDTHPVYLHPTTEETYVHEKTGRTMNNLKGNMLRGTRFEIEKRQGDWVFGRSIAEYGYSGWLPENVLVETRISKLATTPEDLVLLDGPNGSKTGEKAEAGTLFVVLERQGDWAKINYRDFTSAWVHQSQISYDEQDVGVSTMLNTMRFSHKNDELMGSDYSFVNKSIAKYPQSRLLNVIEREAERFKPESARRDAEARLKAGIVPSTP